MKNERTPLYEATNALRYHRQGIIKEIEKKLGKRLICYVSGGQAADISRDDIMGFADLLYNIPKNTNLDLLLHSGGGDIDAAEKLISLVRTSIGPAALFRTIVPDFAKSAGTLMALGADLILMSDTSELGPIDPQVARYEGTSYNVIWYSVQNYLDAYKTHSDALQSNPNDAVARVMLDKLDPTTVKLYESVRDRAKELAERLLRPKGLNFTQIANDLIDTTKWKQHGQVIDWQAARRIGLNNVEYVNGEDEVWMSYWKLYCLQRQALKENEKLFESDHVSLIVPEKRS